MAATYTLYRNYSTTDSTNLTDLFIFTFPPINAIEDEMSGDTFDWSRDGYEFIGWNTARDGSGTSYNAGDTTPRTPTIYYAIWREAVTTPPIDILLGNTSIATLSSSGSVALATAGTYVTEDITIDYTGSSALQSKTVSPSGSTQMITADSGYDGLSSVIVNPIPSEYIIPSGTISITQNGTVNVSQYASASVSVPSITTSYLGTNPVKIADYVGETVALSSTPFTTWTPSTTALVLQNGKDAGTASLDLANYNYVIMWFVDTRFSYDGSQTDKALTLHQCHCIRQDIYKSPNSIANLTNKNYNQNRCTTLFTSGLFDFYNTSGDRGVAYTVNAVVYPTPTGATFSNTTSNTPTLTIKTPSFRIVCNNTYLTAANAGHIVANDTTFRYWGELWRVDKDSIMLGMYKNIIDIYNS